MLFLKYLFLLLSLTLFLACSSKVAYVDTREYTSFSKTKRELKKIYKQHPYTFYCECKFLVNDINRSSCGYKPKHTYTKKGTLNKRALRIEYEHIMPAHYFGKTLPCWKKGGRKACKKSSSLFRQMEADPNNLVPSIGELNADRRNYPYALDPPALLSYGKCKFEVHNKLTYVNENIHGDIARSYLYMSQRYKILLSKTLKLQMQMWDAEDPISPWELKKRSLLIKKSQD